MVSIIIPVYNRDKHLSGCLNSILAQTSNNWEALIIDDGSTDDSLKIINSYCKKDTRLKSYKRTNEHKGASSCRNIGIENAVGEYIIFLDSDDQLQPFCVQSRLNYLKENKELDFLVFPQIIYDEKTKQSHLWNSFSDKSEHLARFLRSDGVWSIVGPIYKSSFIQNHKFKIIDFWQDYELAIRILNEEPKYLCIETKPDVKIIKHNTTSISQTGFYSIEKLQKQTHYLISFYKKLNTHNRVSQKNTRALSKHLYLIALRKYQSRIFFKAFFTITRNSKLIHLNILSSIVFALLPYFNLNRNKSKVHWYTYFIFRKILPKEIIEEIDKPITLGTIPYEK
jgi:glycosyltransferase involved in cell wall biosynthesis